ncbi:RagB/SusD family nutrient uptake outer membrane protein [Puteibacter caeruleilacunae]|nr:RagB/SusD family nutrient uptake outer membrane protein [Puteibacter caeruleilacunae]
MKKIFAILLIGLTFAGCDYLDVVPENLVSYEDAYKGRVEAEKALFGLYNYVPMFDAWRMNVEGVTDEFAVPPGWGAVWFPHKNMWENNISASSLGFNYWTNTDREGINSFKQYNMYEGVRYCHMFKSRIDNVPDLTEDEKTLWKAEADFLIGFYHYYIMMTHGPCVLVDEELSFNSTGDDFFPYRGSVDECTEFILKYWDAAIANLPESVDRRYYGKPTKTVVKALKAKFLTYMASPFWNGNPMSEFNSLADSEGKKLFPAADASKWQRALTALEDAINSAHSAGISLYHYTGSKPQAWESWTAQDQKEVTNRYKIVDKWNDEVIWGYSNVTGTFNWSWQAQGLRTSVGPTRPLNSVQATIESVERFFTKNGLPIDVDPEYDYANRYTVQAGDSTAYLNRDRDPRFYCAVGFDRGKYEFNGKTFVVKHRKGEFNGLLSGVNDCGPTGYVMKKFAHPDSYVDATTINVVQYSYPIIRLADLYLLYAEVSNEIAGSLSGKGLQYLNDVRDRAGVPDLATAWSKVPGGLPSSKEDMREIILKERYNEFAYEYSWYFDVRRWCKAEEVMNKAIHGWNVQGETMEDYNQVQSSYENLNRAFSSKFYLLPIPQTELNVSKNLVQNPGYK